MSDKAFQKTIAIPMEIARIQEKLDKIKSARLKFARDERWLNNRLKELNKVIK